METMNGGWIVIQRRVNTSLDFHRNWFDYEDGFGDLNGEFWYGLRNIHCLTTRYDVELLIDLRNEDGSGISWLYKQFVVAGPDDNYRLTVGQGQGPGFNGMAHHNGRQFSTYDRDNDAYGGNCAAISGGGWWFGSCYDANPNYDPDKNIGTWNTGNNIFATYERTTMMIRPKNCPTVTTC